jgi:hypothetical protein
MTMVRGEWKLGGFPAFVFLRAREAYFALRPIFQCGHSPSP